MLKIKRFISIVDPDENFPDRNMGQKNTYP